MPKLHRITSCGNSAAVTLAADELAHLHRAKGDSVTITKTSRNRLVIQPGPRALMPGWRR
jgi:antitoxin component of MazEF toxin-antitoxin module